MGDYSVNLVIPEGTDTETVTDLSETVITEEMFDVRSAQSKRCRSFAYSSRVSQAERMVNRSRVDFKPGEPGDNVAVPIPLADRGRGDPRNIGGVIVHKDQETDIYKIAVKVGVLNGGFSSSQFMSPKTV